MVMTADEAYAVAERRIEEARDEGLDILDLRDLTALQHLPPMHALSALEFLYLSDTQVADITPLNALSALQGLALDNMQVADITPLNTLSTLQALHLNNTQVADITPLNTLSALLALNLSNTQVADITPLKTLSALKFLDLNDTQVADLRPLADHAFPFKSKDPFVGLQFKNTPAAAANQILTDLSEIKDGRKRTDKTLAYLRTLPPFPAPLPWDVPKPPKTQTITVPQLLEAQDSAGWRFSPEHGTMSLYIRDEPLEARQEQLAKLAAERVEHLLTKNGARNASGGLRQEVAEEAARFAEILQDDTRTLNNRSLDLWGSLLALGGQLEANDTGKREGRDPLDLLTVEARTSLQTLLGVAGNLVRSFPEARALDDGNAEFTRRSVTTDMVLALLEEAMRSKFVDDKSGALIQHVASVSRKTGTQADKALSSTATGGRNLAFVAITLAPFLYAADGVASGILNDIGTDISNQQQLGERANAFIENARDTIEAMLDNSPPDEAARVRSALDDLARSKGAR